MKMIKIVQKRHLKPNDIVDPSDSSIKQDCKCSTALLNGEAITLCSVQQKCFMANASLYISSSGTNA